MGLISPTRFVIDPSSFRFGIMEIIALRQQIGVFPVANVSLMRITRILSSAVGWETESSTSSLTRSELTPSMPAALLDPELWMTSSNSFQSVGIMRSAHTSEGMFFGGTILSWEGDRLSEREEGEVALA